MTGTDRGRGRPIVSFSDDVAAAFLRAVASGTTAQGKAAADLGVSARVIRYHAQHHPDFATALADAKTQGLEVRYPHGHPYRYRHLGCRCPQCITGASKARTTRRTAAANRTTEEDHPGRPDAEITQLPAPVGDLPPLRPAV